MGSRRIVNVAIPGSTGRADKIERVNDAAAKRQLHETRTFPARGEPRLRELVRQRFTHVKSAEERRVVESQHSPGTSPGHIEQPIADTIVE